MSITTKAALMSANTELVAQITQLDAEIAMLRTKCEMLRAQNLQLSTELENVVSVASAINTARKDRPAYVMPTWQVERQEQMAAAKAAAMAHHCVVKV